VTTLLSEYAGWDSASLVTLRQYALSCDRLVSLPLDSRERYKELRANLALLKALDLQRETRP
jgi:hypothetical protein